MISYSPKLAMNTLLVLSVASGILVSQVNAQTSSPMVRPASATASRYSEHRLHRRAEMYYEGAWGVDSLHVKAVESGELIRFTWRVVNAEKAKALTDKKAEPYLVCPRAGIRLVVPQMENIGQLRQSGTETPGMNYWMVFSNPGRHVRPRDRVNVVIGHFHADGLVVE